MKTNKLKWIALTLSALFLLQSCKVYQSKTSDEQQIDKNKYEVPPNG